MRVFDPSTVATEVSDPSAWAQVGVSDIVAHLKESHWLQSVAKSRMFFKFNSDLSFGYIIHLGDGFKTSREQVIEAVKTMAAEAGRSQASILFDLGVNISLSPSEEDRKVLVPPLIGTEVPIDNPFYLLVSVESLSLWGEQASSIQYVAIGPFKAMDQYLSRNIHRSSLNRVNAVAWFRDLDHILTPYSVKPFREFITTGYIEAKRTLDRSLPDGADVALKQPWADRSKRAKSLLEFLTSILGEDI